MSSFSMSQVPYMRGLRGLGAITRDEHGNIVPLEPDVARERAAQQASRAGLEPGEPASTAVQRGRAQAEWPEPQAAPGKDMSPGARAQEQQRGRAQNAVDAARASSEPIEQTIDYSRTTIHQPGIAARPARVSPLAASWEFGLKPQRQTYDFGGGGVKPAWVLGGGLVLLGVAALYLAFKE